MADRHDTPLRSLQNPQVKELVRLKTRAGRRQTGRLRIDGARELLRALEAGVHPDAVYVCHERIHGRDAAAAVAAAEAAGIPLQAVSEEVYERIGYGERQEGLCAVVRWAPAALADLHLGSPALVVVADGLEKPGNLGALLRTAEGAGADAVVLADPTLDPANPNVVRASMGALFAVPLARAGAAEVEAWLEASGLAVLAADPAAATPWYAADLTQPLALVLGEEHGGLRPLWRRQPHRLVALPMAGRGDSLNLAVAAGILLYEAVRQRAGAPQTSRASRPTPK